MVFSTTRSLAFSRIMTVLEPLIINIITEPNELIVIRPFSSLLSNIKKLGCDNYDGVGCSKCMCLPKAGLNTKNWTPNRCILVLVEKKSYTQRRKTFKWLHNTYGTLLSITTSILEQGNTCRKLLVSLGNIISTFSAGPSRNNVIVLVYPEPRADWIAERWREIVFVKPNYFF